MSKIGIIINREYMVRVRKKSFLLTTLIAPVFFVVIIALPILLATLGGDKQQVAVIDRTGEYLPLLKDTDNYTFVKTNKSIDELRKGEMGDSITAVLEIRQDLLEDRQAISLYSFKQLPSGLEEYINKTLSDYLSDKKLSSYNIEGLKDIVRDSKINIKTSTYKWGENGAENKTSGGVASMIGIALTMMSYMFIMMYGSMVLQGVLEEKKSRIMEVMVSSVKPFDMMMGKIIGIGLVGITQLAIWAVLTWILFIIAQFTLLGSLYDASTIASLQASQVNGLAAGFSADDFSDMKEVFSIIQGINFGEIITLFIIFFIGGYLLYSSIFAAIGSAVSSDEDTNQLMVPVTILMVFSFYAGFASMNNPEGPLAFWCSLIPFTSPIVMMVRLPYDVPIWQEILSVILLFATFVGVTWIGAKIYRVGVLMYGKKPSLKEMWKWTKYK
ncbi:ABC transporter permease [Porphyromonas pogonae]|uniref:ABC transporter permease n=1 Tax=Porphyromonas pogonae TaxID=867595 RepID=UPI002E79C786|nr:ABC transporter permease [Porphyromonas pogonae]